MLRKLYKNFKRAKATHDFNRGYNHAEAEILKTGEDAIRDLQLEFSYPCFFKVPNENYMKGIEKYIQDWRVRNNKKV